VETVEEEVMGELDDDDDKSRDESLRCPFCCE
jgi:hypothetical protein